MIYGIMDGDMIEVVDWTKPTTIWVREGIDGEPAFEVKFVPINHTLRMEVTPMHMDGSPAETVKVTAR